MYDNTSSNAQGSAFGKTTSGTAAALAEDEAGSYSNTGKITTRKLNNTRSAKRKTVNSDL